MRKFVVGFLFDDALERVVLIKKNRPDWQKGLLNGVGGHVEEGEHPAVAMSREFEEEAGVYTSADYWADVLTLRFDYAELHVFALRSSGLLEAAKTMTDEPLFKYNLKNNPGWGLRNLSVGNLPALVSLSIQRVSDVPGVAPVAWATSLLDGAS